MMCFSFFCRNYWISTDVQVNNNVVELQITDSNKLERLGESPSLAPNVQNSNAPSILGLYPDSRKENE